ncbi:hypothetical protein E3N88_02706 [Mikania micrantha]|uniref:Uncharacterized protein n=1 Tax=Mikania micrantha TaxID=192012 RepID=A0A5N6Q799_9ASTR|nr:hypothetical protein E3N88_02706 [Mikania micrantha]
MAATPEAIAAFNRSAALDPAFESSTDGLGDESSSLGDGDGGGEEVGEESSDEDGALDEGLIDGDGDGDGVELIPESFGGGDALWEWSEEAVTRPITAMETRAKTTNSRAIANIRSFEISFI